MAAGSGILPAELQTGGYRCLVHPYIYPQLLHVHLHLHLFTRAVGGLMSTELREESYNVVITAGGFDSDAINPLDVTEMLQLLRPEGYLLWTIRTVQCSAVPAGE